MTDEPEKIDLASPDLAAEARTRLETLFPGVIADGVLDATRLGELLDIDVTAPSDGRERYGLMWAGKSEAVRSLQTPSRATLTPDLARSVDWDAAQNAFIEGDNLEVLKLMQKAYNDRVKLIYIDPPYNTGSDFVYSDDFHDGLRQYLAYTGQLDESGKRTSTESDATGGRRHSRWLTMMYPRLVLARNLLTPDGVIAISIDDNEVHHLIDLMDEIFGGDCHLGTIAWLKKRKGSFLSKGVLSAHEYLLVYGREPGIRLFGGSPDSGESQPLIKKTNPIGTLRFPAGSVTTRLADGHYTAGTYGDGESAAELLNGIDVVAGRIETELELRARFIWVQRYLDEQVAAGGRIVMNTINLQPRAFKAPDEEAAKGLSSIFDGVANSATNEDAFEEGKRIFGVEGLLDYPKPLNYIKAIVASATHFDPDAIVLDFFAGSGTTGQAVSEINAEDGGTRKWVLVQLPEATPEGSRARMAGYGTIAELAVARLERTGVPAFRRLRLSDSNFESIAEGDELLLSATTLRDPQALDAVAEEVLLKEGVALDAPWQRRDAAGAEVVLAGHVAVVLTTEITSEVVARAIELEASVLVFLEDGFAGRDAVKTNAFTNSKQAGIKMKTV